MQHGERAFNRVSARVLLEGTLDGSYFACRLSATGAAFPGGIVPAVLFGNGF